MSKYSLLLFDLDGTIADTFPCLVKSMEHFYKKYGDGNLPSEAKLATFSGPPMPDTMRKEFPDQDPIALTKEFVEVSLTNYPTCTLIYDGCLESLKKLKQNGLHIAIVTNKSHKPSELVIDVLHLNDLIEDVIGIDEVKNPKPDGEGCLTMMKRFGITNPNEVLYIGDNTTDLITAKNAGIDCALVSWGPNPVDMIYEPAIKADTFEELTEKILNA